MKPESVIIAEAVSESGGRFHVLGGGITRFTPPRVPWVEPGMGLIVRLALEQEDVGEDRAVRLAVLDPEGRQVVELMAVIEAEQIRARLDQALPGETSTLQLVARFGSVGFRLEGIYEVLVESNGVEVARSSFPVVVAQPAPP